MKHFLTSLLLVATFAVHAQNEKAAAKIPEKTTVYVHIDSTENVHFVLASVPIKEKMADVLIPNLFDFRLTPAERERFLKMTRFCFAMQQLPEYLAKPDAELKKLRAQRRFLEGPEDDLVVWIIQVHNALDKIYWAEKKIDPSLEFSQFDPVYELRADKGVSLQKVKAVIQIFDDAYMITDNVLPASEKLNKPLVLTFGHKPIDESEIMVSMPEPEEMENYIFTYTEEFAAYPGGDKALKAYMKQNLVYPKTAADRGIEGFCAVRFIVEKDGSISEPEIMRNVMDCPECDAEALRVVREMSNWVPGKNGGSPVRSYSILRVPFPAK